LNPYLKKQTNLHDEKRQEREEWTEM